jgi:hypothetical protein
MTPKRPIGVRQRGRGSHRESFLLPIRRLGVLYDSESHSYALFSIAIRIRVNTEWDLAVFGHCIRTALAAF